MASNTTLLYSDSQNPPTPPFAPHPGRIYWLTDAAIADLAAERCAPPPDLVEDDEYAFTCVFCEKAIPACQCGMRGIDEEGVQHG